MTKGTMARVPTPSRVAAQLLLKQIKARVLYAVTLACTLSLAMIIPRRPICGDALVYVRIAIQPTRFTAAPWGYRLLTPWLIHLLPLPILTGFFVVTVAGLGIAATAIGLICSSIRLSLRSSLIAPILFLLSYAGVYNLHNFALIDALAYVGTTFCLLFLVNNSLHLAALCILVTTIDKEWGIFLIPMLILAIWKQRDRGTKILLAPITTGCLAPLGYYLAVRHWPGFGDQAYNHYYTLSLVRQMLMLHQSDIVVTLLDANLLFWILAPLGWRTLPPSFRVSLWIVPIALAQLLFATDGTRMLAYSYPCLIPLVLAGLDHLPLWQWTIAMCLLLVAGSRLLLTLLSSNTSFIDIQFTIFATLAIMTFIAFESTRQIKPDDTTYSQQ